MIVRPRPEHRSSPPGQPGDGDEIPRQRLLDLLPRRTLWKVLSLLLLLVGVIYFKSKTAGLARVLQGVAGPVAPAREGRRVRMQIDAAPGGVPAFPGKP